MPNFIKGRELSRLFYQEAVSPILRHRFSGVRHTACLIGPGSDVIGYDTEESTDHDWGPRLQLFLSQNDWNHESAEIDEQLATELPRMFHGFSTGFSVPDGEGVRIPDSSPGGPIRHAVRINTVNQFFKFYLGTDPFTETSVSEWMTFPEQTLLETTRAAIFHDDLGLEGLLAKFRYYPHDIWLYLLASQWRRIEQLEPLMGRSGAVGDELGSTLIANQIVLDLARLCFLMAKRYAPYAKWLGTAFRDLDGADLMIPVLSTVLTSNHWKQREDNLAEAYELVASMHNALSITEPIHAHVRPFHNRPYRVIEAQNFAQAISNEIVDPHVRSLPHLLGSVDQISHSVDILSRQRLRDRLRNLYNPT